ncbi:Flp family type IVb pilin [Defluviimonas salinarum]|uniref:Flp family type IVb pilin n=1 Tax=Defluviimonas salinarum TaxID=2992147 RepID=A0ABT3J428_9RHOB|nr:hypothetical protein [Defluviimonas salinarum]MCW3782450.1 hypothetical protein [Defluviimonas salinarum]
MRFAILKKWKQFGRDEKGVTLVEYGVGVMLAVLVFGLFGAVLAPEINGAFIEAGTSMPGTSQTFTLPTW